MRNAHVGLAAAAALLAGPSPAFAVWSAPRTFDARHDGGGRLAVNERGDAAVVWTSRAPARLRITMLPAKGPRVTRVLSRRRAQGPSVVLDERGAATVIWLRDRRLYARHGSARGRWRAPELVARGPITLPELAVSPTGTVLVVWTNDPVTGPGSTGVSWRGPGRGFSDPVTLRRPAPGLMPGELPQSDNGVTFDARGRAYLWGTCDGVVRVTRPGSRRFRALAATPGRALGLSVAVGPDGGGLVSWADSRCTGDPSAGSEPGPVRARTLRAGVMGPPTTLTGGGPRPTPLIGSGTRAFALAGAGSLVSVSSLPDPVEVRLDADGAQSDVTPGDRIRLPFAADADGNLIVSAPYVGYVVRTARGAEEPFDKGGTGPNPPSIGASAAVVSGGVGFGVIWDPDLTFGPDNRGRSPARRLSVSLWKP